MADLFSTALLAALISAVIFLLLLLAWPGMRKEIARRRGLFERFAAEFGGSLVGRPEPRWPFLHGLEVERLS